MNREHKSIGVHGSWRRGFRLSWNRLKRLFNIQYVINPIEIIVPVSMWLLEIENAAGLLFF